MKTDILTAIALYMMIEGLIPFVGPQYFRRAVVRISEMDDNQLRMTGLMTLAAGLVLFYFVRF